MIRIAKDRQTHLSKQNELYSAGWRQKKPRKGSGNITLTIDYQKTFIRDIISLIQTNCKKYFFHLWVSRKIWKNIHEEI